MLPLHPVNGLFSWAYGPADASASPNSHLLPHLNPDWFYLSVTGLPRLSWKSFHIITTTTPGSQRVFMDILGKPVPER